MSDSIKRVGRPSKDVSFPVSGEFGITELELLNPNVSRVTLQFKVNQKLEQNTLRVSGLRKNDKGRPSKLFSTI
jgi:hypothetical protein